MPLLLLAQLLIALPASLAQPTTKCSCSPRKYVFKLNLAAICPPLPPPFPPNEVFGAGVKDYTCTIGPEPLPSAPQQLTSADTAPELVTNEVEELEEDTTNSTNSTRIRGRRAQGPNPNADVTAFDLFPELETELEAELEEKEPKTLLHDFPELKDCLESSAEGTSLAQCLQAQLEDAQDAEADLGLEEAEFNFTTSQTGGNTLDSVPVSIYSIQFLEVDTSFNVINQDSTYVRGIDFTTGDTFEYTSIVAKEDRPVLAALESQVIPGGMNMVLRGVNAAGAPVRNVFTITYTNDCGVQTFSEGDAIGWVIFENFEPASAETCDAPVTPSPTRKPIDMMPTSPSPTKKPSSKPSPSKKPSSKMPSHMSMAPVDPEYPIYGKSSKSTKMSKVSAKSSKSAKSAKSSKSSKASSSWSSSKEDGHHGKIHGYKTYAQAGGKKMEPVRDLYAEEEPEEEFQEKEGTRGRRGLKQNNRRFRAANNAFLTDRLFDEMVLDHNQGRMIDQRRRHLRR